MKYRSMRIGLTGIVLLACVFWLPDTYAEDVQNLVVGQIYKHPDAYFCTSLQSAQETVRLAKTNQHEAVPDGCFNASIEFQADYKLDNLSAVMDTIVKDSSGPDRCSLKSGESYNCKTLRQKNGFIAARMNYQGNAVRIFVLLDDRVKVISSAGGQN
jgi:hypothetical protein